MAILRSLGGGVPTKRAGTSRWRARTTAHFRRRRRSGGTRTSRCTGFWTSTCRRSSRPSRDRHAHAARRDDGDQASGAADRAAGGGRRARVRGKRSCCGAWRSGSARSSTGNVVTGVANIGVFVQLPEFQIDGLVRFADLPDDWWGTRPQARHAGRPSERDGGSRSATRCAWPSPPSTWRAGNSTSASSGRAPKGEAAPPEAARPPGSSSNGRKRPPLPARGRPARPAQAPRHAPAPRRGGDAKGSEDGGVVVDVHCHVGQLLRPRQAAPRFRFEEGPWDAYMSRPLIERLPRPLMRWMLGVDLSAGVDAFNEAASGFPAAHPGHTERGPRGRAGVRRRSHGRRPCISRARSPARPGRTCTCRTGTCGRSASGTRQDLAFGAACTAYRRIGGGAEDRR